MWDLGSQSFQSFYGNERSSLTHVQGMQRCIEKAMRQVRPEGVRCDYLVGDGEIILKEAWEGMVRGGMCVKAGVWPEETKVGKGVRS